MGSISQRNSDFYKEKGIEALETRVKSLIKLFNENKFPVTQIMFGFGQLKISDSQECLARILELSDLIGFQANLNLNNKTKKAEIKY